MKRQEGKPLHMNYVKAVIKMKMCTKRDYICNRGKAAHLRGGSSFCRAGEGGAVGNNTGLNPSLAANSTALC